MMDVEGNPIPRFKLKVASRVAAGQSVQVTGDQDGIFEIDNFPLGKVLLTTSSSPSFVIELSIDEDDNGVVPLVLDLGIHELRGRIVDIFDDPVAGSSVALSWTHQENGVKSSAARSTFADADGQFVIPGLGPGPHTLRIYSSGFRPNIFDHDVATDPNDIEIRLEDIPQS
jgi:hypothetical protein